MAIQELKPDEVTSEELADLRPRTQKDYLMIMWPTQQKILKHLEDLNGWRQDFEGRVSWLEGAFKVTGAITGGALALLALKTIFGG